jgi:hypothetical protein
MIKERKKERKKQEEAVTSFHFQIKQTNGFRQRRFFLYLLRGPGKIGDNQAIDEMQTNWTTKFILRKEL